MDSFEQYGELMNQWDSASPPGDKHRRIFDKSLMGMEMCGGGGGKSSSNDDYIEFQEEQADRTYEYNNKLHDHATREGHAAVAFAQETVDLQRKNQEAQLSFQDETRYKDWLRQSTILGLQNTAQAEAYNKSEVRYTKQSGLNVDAAVGAAKGADNRKREREIERELNRRETNLEATGSKLKLNTARKEAAFKASSNFIEGIKEIGAVSYNTGRSAVKKKISAISQVAGISAALAEQINSQESEYNLELMGFDIKRLGLAQTKLSIGRQYTAEYKQIAHQLKQADLQADANRMAKPKMMPPIPKPQALPRQEFQDPRPYVEGPRPIKGAVNYSASGGGGGGGGGGVGGAMAAVGGAMAALPVASGAAGSAAGMAMGFGVGSAVPIIGTAIAGVGLLGSAFNWW